METGAPEPRRSTGVAALAQPTALGPGGAPTAFERWEYGRACRKVAPRASHAGWQAAPGRRDPLNILEESNRDRVPELVPIRYGRMAVSPFAFLRGSAAVMAADLAVVPTTGLTVQACGDAHLLNFGLFATPERHLVFDVNDFDETLPAPWEWDLKRLAASVAVAAGDYGFAEDTVAECAAAGVLSYQRLMGTYAAMGHLDVWYARIDVESLEDLASGPTRQVLSDGVRRARRHTHLQSLDKLTTVVDGTRQLVDDPPLLVHVDYDDMEERIHFLYQGYVASLADDRRHLLDRYRLVDWALKVVGVGSVGTRCSLALLQGASDDDVLFLQIKEACPSVLEPYAEASRYRLHGQRVVEGQRLMQAASDIFLGWAAGMEGVHFYFRQFHDMKGSFDLARPTPTGLIDYARLCGWALARAHARSGNAPAISGYLGTGDRFARSVTAFAQDYAEQTRQDHALLVEAIRDGRVEARNDG